MSQKIYIFDLNGVLLEYSVIDLIKLTWNYKKKWDLIINLLNPILSFKALKFALFEPVVENGVLKLIKNYPKLEAHKEFMLSAINCQRLKQESLNTINSLKNNDIQIYALSNIGEISINILKIKYPEFFNMFDKIYCTQAQDNYLCKPSKEFFKKYLKQINHQQKIYFIDDKKENLKTAKELEFYPIHFKNHKQLNNLLTTL